MDIRDFDKLINFQILKKGRAYYQDGGIEYPIYQKEFQTFKTRVSGTMVYDTTVTIHSGEIKGYTCTCPVKGLCKHVAGVLIKIKEDVKLLELAVSNIPKSDMILEENLPIITKQQFLDQKDYQSFFDFIIKQKKHDPIDKIATYFNFSKYKIKDEQDFANHMYEGFKRLEAVYNVEALEKMLLVYFSNESSYHFNIYHNQLIEANQDAKLGQLYAQVLAKKKPSQFKMLRIESPLKTQMFINMMASNAAYHLIFMKAYEFMKVAVLEFAKISHEVYPFEFMEALIKNPTQETLLPIGNLVSKEAILNAFLDLKLKPKSLKDALIFKKQIGYEFQYESFDITLDVAKDCYQEIKENDLENFSNYIKKQLDNQHYYYQKIAKSETLKMIALFDLIDDDILNSTYRYELLMLGLLKDDHTLVITKGGLPDKLKKYVAIDAGLDYYLRYAEFTIIVSMSQTSFKEDIVIMKSEKNNVDVYFKATIDNGIFSYDNDYEPFAKHAFGMLMDKTQDDINDKFDDAIKRLEDVRTEIVKQNEKTAHIQLVDALSDNLIAKEKLLVTEKVWIRPVLVLDYEYKNQQLYLKDYPIISLKIGNSSDYNVKNVETFLDSLDTQATVSYGKNLVFKHYMDQFDNQSQILIQLLETYKDVAPYKTNTGIILPLQKIEKLMENVREFYMVDESIGLLSKEPKLYKMLGDFSVSIYANEQGFSLNIPNQMLNATYILRHQTFDLLVSKYQHTVSKIKYTSDKQRTLVHFILDHPQFKFETVKDKIASKIMPFIKDVAKIDEALLTYANQHALKIKSYFDYDKDKDYITVTHTYMEGTNKIDDPNTVASYGIVAGNYEKLLMHFGIYDGFIKHQQDVLLFMNADLTLLKEHAEIYISDVLSKMRIKKMPRIRIEVKVQEGMLKTHIGQTNFDEETLKSVLKAYKEGKKYILLKDEVILTDTEEVKALSDFITHYDLDPNHLNATYSHPMYHLFKFEEDSDYLSIEIEEKLKMMMARIRNYKDKVITHKPNTYALLKNYQVDGLKWLQTLYEQNLGGILADDMGLGKTLQVISLLESIETKGLILVACPKSLVYNWSHELSKFKANFKHVIYAGLREERETIFNQMQESHEKLMVIVSYDTLRNDIDLFKTVTFDTAILDEAQHIKTITAMKTLATKEIKALHKFVLTGTPLENAVSDLWSIFDFLMPGYLYHYAKFKKLESRATESDKEALDFIVGKTKPFILRRTKKEVLKDLPDKVEELMYTTFDEAEQKIYDAYLLDVKKKIESPGITKFDLLADLTRLRQLCLSPKLIYTTYEQTSSKIETAVSLIKSAIASGHKILLFSSFVKALDLLKKHFDKDTYFMLTGQTDAKDRVMMTTLFNDETSTQKVFLISLKAGGTGLNLTGADIVIHLDPWWNLAAENQATDRAHRIGQKQKVTVYKMIAKGTIEEKVIELQERKKELFDKIIEGKDTNEDKMSFNEYRFLLE